ncbi:hypothetical protein Ddye_031512 [Dipteronia dyeriana]|uniref:RING-type E3 ubiquitin transferase n=1 Tax=Dipteronia dyeriana TaxID=168575 RepID=A0AAD9WNT4_9ROSI|nr:hypothetical protein Ddye_031512 [Dipteronia dyeriana]
MSFHTCPDLLYILVGQRYAVHSINTYSSQSQPCSSLLPHHLHVALKISYKHCRQFIDCLTDGSTVSLGEGPPSRQERSCILNLCGFMKESNTSYATLAEKLSSFGIQRQAVHGLIGRIFFHGHRILGSKKYSNVGSRGSTVIFPIHVEITRKQTILVNYERYLMQRALRESMVEFERRNYGMVPTSESSLKNMLKRVRVAVADDAEEGSERKRKRVEISSSSTGENCSICLEELEAGSYGTSMPCSHMFHDGCIVKWLKQSHYCPVCRYEMPTTN